MLTGEEVKKYAHMRRLKLLDQIWKDYLQDLLLQDTQSIDKDNKSM